MARSTLAVILAALLWVVWCILVVYEVVPALRLHVTMWSWLMAYVLCVAPVIVLAVVLVAQSRRV